jgi:carbonic anhydrase
VWPCWASAQKEKAVTPTESLQALKEGNARFVADKLIQPDTSAKRRKELVKGQHPSAIILTCADSRVVPELIFNKGLGEMFVIRVAGNVVDSVPSILGSLEYAVAEVKVPLVVVLGHEGCGAVKAALQGEELPGNLKQLIKSIHVGKDLPKDKTAALDAAVKANALHQVQQLTRQSTILKDFATSQRIRIVPAVYSLSTGEVTWLETREKK